MSLNVNNNVGYTVVDGGSISVVNGIASGFSTNDYLETSQTLSFSTQQKIEIATKITTGDTVSTSGIIGPRYGNSTFGIYLQGNKPSTMFYYNNGQAGKNSYNTSSVSLNTNTTYYLKAIYDIQNVTSTIMVSTDGINYTSNTKTLNDFASWYTWIDNNAYRIGNTQSGTFAGSIDLNNTYIKVNGITWFNGKEQASPTVNEVYLNRNVGYKVVGSPTIVDGVASGLSNSDYLRLASVPNLSNDFEIGITFTLNNTSNCTIIGNDNFYYQGIILYSTNAPSFILNGTNYNVSVSLPRNTVQLGHTYHIVVKREGNRLSISAFENNQMIASNQASIGDDFLYRTIYTYQIGKGPDGVLNGSIDLNETYIKVNGVTWFSGKEQASPTVNEVYLNRNVGYKVVGNPTIVDGVASGFSKSDYLRATRPLGSANLQSCDIRIKCKTGDAIIDNMPLLYCTGSPYWFAVRVNRDRMQLLTRNAENTTYMEVKSSITIQASMGYIIEATITTDKQTLKLYTWDNELLSNKFLSVGGGVYFNADLTGEMRVGSSIDIPWNGSIDLNETYIKMNGITWFNGKQTATTPVWTRSV